MQLGEPNLMERSVMNALREDLRITNVWRRPYDETGERPTWRQMLVYGHIEGRTFQIATPYNSDLTYKSARDLCLTVGALIDEIQPILSDGFLDHLASLDP